MNRHFGFESGPMALPPPFPERLFRLKGKTYVAYKRVHNADFTDAFVNETLRRAPAITEFAELNNVLTGDGQGNSGPAGIIYHVSKCGSTLVSQLLKRLPGLTVYSQPSAWNDALDISGATTRAVMVEDLKRLAALFSQHSHGRYVIKSESWNALYWDLIQSAFPNTPWIFCFRDPVEVAVSALEDPDPSLWMKYHKGSGHNPFADQLSRPTSSATPLPEYVALIYESLCMAILRQGSPSGRVVGFQRLPHAVWTDVAAHFGLSMSNDIRCRMAEEAQFYSKSPLDQSRRFMDDSHEKWARASDEIKKAISRIARPVYERLRNIEATQ
jgi:hypothetical protein